MGVCWRQFEVYLCYLAYKGRQEIFSPDGVVMQRNNKRLAQKDVHGIEVRCFFKVHNDVSWCIMYKHESVFEDLRPINETVRNFVLDEHRVA